MEIGAPGILELTVIAAIGLVMIGIPIAVIAIVLLLVRRSNASRNVDQQGDVDHR